MGSKFIVPLRLLELNTTPALPLTSWHKLYYKDGYLKTLKGSEKDVVLDRPLDGFVAGPCLPITATDTVLEAFQKLQCQITAIPPQVNADWLATSGPALILNKPDIPQLCGNPLSDILPGDTLVICRWNGSSFDTFNVDASSLLGGDNIYNADGQIQSDRFITFANAGTGDALGFFANGVIGNNSLIFGVQDGQPGQPELARVFIGASYLRNSLAFFVECKTSFLNTIGISNNDAAEPYHIILQDNQAGGPVSRRLHLNTLPLNTVDRFQQFQNKDGIIALLSDIPVVPPTLSYGIFNQLKNSTPVQGVTNNSGSLFISGPGNSVGSLQVPANTFQEGDGFKLEGAGHLSVTGPPPDLTLRVLFNGSPELTITIPSIPNVSDLHWRMEINFTIRSIGATGEVMTAVKFFHEENANDKVNGHSATQLSTLNTTVPNELDITATWTSGDDTDSIYSEIMTLSKIY